MKAMTGSGAGSGGRPDPHVSMLPGLGAPQRTASLSDLAPRALSLLSMPLSSRAPSSTDELRGPRVAGSSSRAPKPTKISSAQARAAHKCALDGGRLIKSGRPAEAIALLQRSVKLNPGVAAYHHDLGFALWSAKRMREAIGAFTAAVRLDPRNESAHRLLGHIFDSLGNKAMAMVSFQAAVKLVKPGPLRGPNPAR